MQVSKVGIAAYVTTVIMSAFVAGTAYAETMPTAEEMIRLSDEQMRGTTAIGVYEMTIVNPDWERSLKMRFWEDVDADRAFIRILEPARERGTSSLKIGNEMWTYMPDVERSMKVPPSMMSQGWMGSDLTNEDLVNGDDFVRQYEHELIDTAVVSGERVYVVRSSAKPESPVVWEYIIYYARMSDYLPVREDFFDEDSVHVRRMEFSDFVEMDGRVIPTMYVIEPLTEEDRGKRTMMRIVEMDFDARIRRDTFTLQNLERAR
jgi:hypothetical protein